MDTDVVVIGAGVIGLAIAYKFSKQGSSVILLEKEEQYGTGVSSRSTETIHAGIYYSEDSLKALLCVRGKDLLYEHCRKYGITAKNIGKIFVAVTDEEISRLERTKEQALKNGVEDLTELNEAELKRLEPNIQGKAGLFSPSSGIFDSHSFMKSLFMLGQSEGVVFAAASPVVGADSAGEGWNVKVGGSEPAVISSKIVVNAAGLYAIKLSKRVFPERDIPALCSVKGSYLRYSGSAPFKHIIYPSIIPGVVEERVDAAPDIGGSLRFGPNVEDSEGLEDFGIDTELVSKMSGGIKRYFPDLDISRLHPDSSGIRPKLYGKGDAVEDFRFEWGNGTNWLDLWGIESPGLTASLAIAEYVDRLIKERDIL